MFRIIEVAKMLGVSKVTVYKKIEMNKALLKPHVIYRSNIMHLDEKGVEVLSGLLTHINVRSEDTDALEKEYTEALEERLERLTKRIEGLRKISEEKSKLIDYYSKKIKVCQAGEDKTGGTDVA